MSVLAKRLPDFKQLLGEGAFARVYEVETPQGLAVMKVARGAAFEGMSGTQAVELTRGALFFTGGRGEWSPDPAEVLSSEARQLRGIHHPAFVKVLDEGRIDVEGVERPYLLLERVIGTTWRELLDRGKAPDRGAFRELVAVLQAVQHSGELAYHGDLKPENLMIDRGRALRVLDPCSAINRYDAAGFPERVLYTEAYNPQAAPSDLPALGLILLELLTGANPLRSGAASTVTGIGFGPRFRESLEVAQRLGQSTLLARLAGLRPNGSTGVAIALRCLGLGFSGGEIELAAPYASLQELAQDLGSLD